MQTRRVEARVVEYNCRTDVGIHSDRELINICIECMKDLEKKRVPHLELKNGLEVGRVPPELEDLTWAEQRLIAIYRVHIDIMHFSGHDTPRKKDGLDSQQQQPKLKGSVYCVPQDVLLLNTLLPPSHKQLPAMFQVSCLLRDRVGDS